MKKKLEDFGAVKNQITDKTIREMTWDELFSLPTERLSTAEAMRRIKEAISKAKSK